MTIKCGVIVRTLLLLIGTQLMSLIRSLYTKFDLSHPKKSYVIPSKCNLKQSNHHYIYVGTLMHSPVHTHTEFDTFWKAILIWILFYIQFYSSFKSSLSHIMVSLNIEIVYNIYLSLWSHILLDIIHTKETQKQLT